MRKGLVGFQFSISVVLIIAVLTVQQQIEYVQQKKLGFNKEQVILFPKEGKLKTNYTSFINRIEQIPGVVSSSTVRNDLANNGTSTRGVRWEGSDPENPVLFKYISADYNFIETMGMELVAGRAYDEKFGDEQAKIIFNETAIRAMGIADPIGKTVVQWGKEKQIIGVVKDFHLQSMYEKIKPCFINLSDKGMDVLVKIQSQTEAKTLAQINSQYTAFNDGLAFEYEYLDASYQRLYASEKRVSVLAKYFAGIAILISCLGLLGLATFSTQRRKREIGIRKVLGASTLGVIQLLSIDFIKIVTGAIFIALPISYWLSQNWLSGFAFRMELPLWFFLGTGLGALLLAWLTISYQIFAAAKTNPVQSIKASN